MINDDTIRNGQDLSTEVSKAVLLYLKQRSISGSASIKARSGFDIPGNEMFVFVTIQVTEDFSLSPKTSVQ